MRVATRNRESKVRLIAGDESLYLPGSRRPLQRECAKKRRARLVATRMASSFIFIAAAAFRVYFQIFTTANFSHISFLPASFLGTSSFLFIRTAILLISISRMSFQPLF